MIIKKEKLLEMISSDRFDDDIEIKSLTTESSPLEINSYHITDEETVDIVISLKRKIEY